VSKLQKEENLQIQDLFLRASWRTGTNDRWHKNAWLQEGHAMGSFFLPCSLEFLFKHAWKHTFFLMCEIYRIRRCISATKCPFPAFFRYFCWTL
jgi:hypothetical protein